MKEDKVSGKIQKLGHLRSLASSDSTEEFVLAYMTILNSNSSTQPVLVEKICNARQDISRQVGTCPMLFSAYSQEF